MIDKILYNSDQKEDKGFCLIQICKLLIALIYTPRLSSWLMHLHVFPSSKTRRKSRHRGLSTIVYKPSYHILRVVRQLDILTSKLLVMHVQSNLDYPNPFGQLQNLSVWISKKKLFESLFDVRLTTPTPISNSVYHRLNSMFYPILAENSSTFTPCTTFLDAILAFLTVICTSIANDGCTALYCACTYQYRTRYLYFDLQFLLGSKFG